MGRDGATELRATEEGARIGGHDEGAESRAENDDRKHHHAEEGLRNTSHLAQNPSGPAFGLFLRDLYEPVMVVSVRHIVTAQGANAEA